MKLVCLLILTLSAQLVSGATKSLNTAIGSGANSEKVTLNGIQDSILHAFYTDMGTRRDVALPMLRDALTSALKTSSISQEQLLTYWLSYAQYYSAIYYMQTQQPAKASAAIDDGIARLEGCVQKGSEEYALLARLQGIGMAYAGPKAPTMSRQMVENGARAIELDTENVRAYTVAAINDYFTPKAFGGRRKAKAYLEKALTLSTQRVKSDFQPSWGREEAFEYLLRYLLEEEKGTGAAELYDKAIQEFPNSYMIRSLATKIKGQ